MDVTENLPVIEVLHNADDMAIEGGLAIDADRHEIQPDGMWIEWARKITRRPLLFIYRHKESGNFMVAEWIKKPNQMGIPTCVELFQLEGPPDSVCAGRPTEEVLRARCIGARFEYDRWRKEEIDSKREARRDREERGRLKEQHCAMLRRKGFHLEAYEQENDPHWTPTTDEEIHSIKDMSKAPTVYFHG